jgi:hypothetical protein
MATEGKRKTKKWTGPREEDACPQNSKCLNEGDKEVDNTQKAIRTLPSNTPLCELEKIQRLTKTN